MRASVLLVGALLFLPVRTVASFSVPVAQNQSGAISGLVKDPAGAGYRASPSKRRAPPSSKRRALS